MLTRRALIAGATALATAPANALTKAQELLLLGAVSSVVPPRLRGSVYLLAQGDSITQNNRLGITSYPAVYNSKNPGAPTLTIQNNAVSGSGLSTLVADEAADIAFIAANPGYANYILTVMIGVNERLNATYYPSGSAQFGTDLAAYIAAMKAGGYTKIVVATLADVIYGTQATTETWRTAMNNVIKALYPASIDAIFDVGASPLMQNAANTTYFVDGLHFTNVGQIVAEKLYAPAVNGVSVAAVVPGTTTALAAGTAASTSMPLTWTPPGSGGYYTTFTVQYALASSNSWTAFAHADSRTASITVTGLTPSTSYDFRVAATGEGGTGAWSSTVTKSTTAAVANTWDTVALGSPLALSNGNLTATNASGGSWATARSSISKASGKWYAEVKFITNGDGNLIIGASNDAANAAGMATNVGSVVESGGVSVLQTNYVTAGFTAAVTLTFSAAAGDIFGIAMDVSAKKMWLSKNGVWQGSGDPVNGLTPWITWTSAYTMCIAGSMYAANDALGFQGAGAQTYTAPTGFSAWG